MCCFDSLKKKKKKEIKPFSFSKSFLASSDSVRTEQFFKKSLFPKTKSGHEKKKVLYCLTFLSFSVLKVLNPKGKS
jgi:hypothetical protein